MSFRPELFDYLDHFGKTAPVGELNAAPDATDVIGLRHDVDHTLDLALELAWIEAERGLRASYYVLSGHDYAASDLFLEKCLQIHALGHEVGIHNDALTRWIRDGRTPEDTIREFLERLRGQGIRITGTSTHGDRQCYEHGYLNSWCFREAKTDVGGRYNAEGLPTDDPDEAIAAPDTGEIDVDGRRLPLWAVSMDDLGLAYEAHRIPVDRYYTDSGGSWQRSPDPLTEDVRRGRVQVLMHPEWWGSKRRVFFLSTARSGSMWLANLLDRATSSVARHELTLNHTYEDGALHEDKRTGEGFRSFIDEREAVRARLRSSAAWISQLHDDYAEANVYLAHCLDELREVFPDATFVHLHRDGREVVRSLLNRSWYDTPEDDRHPDLDVEGWSSLSQLEKCCWYWARTNQAISTVADLKLPLERAASDPEFLRTFLENLGIRVTLPDLFDGEHPRRLNEGYANDVPPYEDWPDVEQQVFTRICGPVQALIGYTTDVGTEAAEADATRRPAVEASRYEHRFRNPDADEIGEYRATRCELELADGGLRIVVRPDRGGHATVHLGTGGWAKPDPGRLFWADHSGYYRLEIDTELDEGLAGSAHVLMYDAKGELLRTPHRRALRPGSNDVRLSFWPTPSCRSFTFGFFFNEETSGNCLVRSVRLIAFGEADGGSAIRQTDRFYRSEDGFGYTEEFVTEWVRSNVELPERGRVLDLCCGNGIWSKGIKSLNRRLKLYGIDISQGGIEKARRLLRAGKRRFVVGDAEAELPFKKGFFDVVFARGPGLYNQHEMDRPATIGVIEQWHEHLKPGGRFYSIFASSPDKLGTYTPPDEVKLPYNRYPRRTETVDFRGGKYHHTTKSFLAPFESAANVEIESYSFERGLHILVTRIKTDA